MNKRQAMITAHRYASDWITQAIASAPEGMADDEVESDKITEALEELARRHDLAAQRLMTTGSNPSGGES